MNQNNYDLEERTLLFSKNLLDACRGLPRNSANSVISRQVLRSGMSIGANYREANQTKTARDLNHRLSISIKEARETLYWLELLIHANPENKIDLALLNIEATEVVKILATIYKKVNSVVV